MPQPYYNFQKYGSLRTTAYEKMTSLPTILLFVELLYFLSVTVQPFSLKNCTIQSSENVVEALCDNRALTEIPDDIPHNTNQLFLNVNTITEIKQTDLRNLSELVSLILTHNHLSHIEDKAFAYLKELKILKLSYNKLTNLTDHIFNGLAQLQSLYLDFNHIVHVSPHAIQPLVNLQIINLNYNFIHNISDIATLFHLPTVEKVSLGTNHITSLDWNVLPLNTTSIKSLYLNSNPIKRFSLKQNIFPHLQNIDLSSSITHIDWDVVNQTFLSSVTEISLGGLMSLNAYNDILRSAVSLQKISLTGLNKNNISSLIMSACSISTLKTLIIQYSILIEIDDNLLSLCSNLSVLSLNLNRMKGMSEQSLKSLRQIRYLDIHGNELLEVPATIQGLSTLETLDLSVNYIGELKCFDFSNLTKLKTLNLRANHIAKVERCVFQNLLNLKSLNIGKNRIHSLDYGLAVNFSNLATLILSKNLEHLQIRQGDLFTLSSLQVLKLDYVIYYLQEAGIFEGLNNLKSLTFSVSIFTEKLFQGLTQLENLQLHLHLILNMRDSQNTEPPFSLLPNLKILSLKLYVKDSLTPRPDMLKGLNRLQSLAADNIFHAQIHQDTFKHTPKLTCLKIINGDLSVLSLELFEPIPNLEQLDLSNNTFRTLDFLANLKALEWLKVTENQLSVMNDTLIKTLPALIYLDLTNNPLSCECSNADFVQWVITNNQTQVINGHQYKCAFPASQQGHSFLAFDIGSCWIDVGLICFISSSSLILLVLVVSLVFNFLRFQLAYVYYLFLAYVYDTKAKRRGAGHLYDAFISYNVHDEDWVYNEMLLVLEGEQGWRLCLHHRDFEPEYKERLGNLPSVLGLLTIGTASQHLFVLIHHFLCSKMLFLTIFRISVIVTSPAISVHQGKPIVENITDAIYRSRKTICVISRHYLQSEWCSREIQMASVRLFDEKKDVLILVFLEDIPTWKLSPYYKIRRVVKKHTYLSWPQAAQHKGVFWQKVNQALNTDNDPRDNKHLIINPEDDN